MDSKPKLTYFNFKGAAEPIRYLFEYAKIDYEDIRIPAEDWPKVKPNYLFGQLPVIEVNGKIINQTVPICRYYAKKIGLAGADDFEALQIEAIADTIGDLRQLVSDYRWHSTGELQETKKKILNEEKFPLFFKRFEALLKENNGYFVNGKLSYAEFFFAGTIPYINHCLKRDVLEGYPLLKGLMEKVNDLPQVKEWIRRRPDTPY